MFKRNPKGFTLIELLVVIAIFALIANVTMVSLNKAKRESRDAERMSDINQLRSALHLYSIENLSYPDGTGIPLGTGDYLVLDTNGWSSSPVSPIYMYAVPRDPKMVAAAASACADSSTNVCDYGYSVNGNDFVIYFYLEGTIGSMVPGLHVATKDTVL